MNRNPTLLSLPPRRRGVALLLVLGVVIMASVLGYAMLSSAAMSKQASHNAAVSASAQGIAESGVNLALYYLQNPGHSPTYPATYPQTETYERAGGFWEGTNGQWVDLGSPSIGQVKVTVSRPDVAIRRKYQIEAFGRAPDSILERHVLATTYVNAEYRIDHATVTTNDVTWTGNTRIDGNAYSNGGNTLPLGTSAMVYGHGIRRKLTSSIRPSEGWGVAPLVPKVIPTYDEVRSYLTYELPLGVVNDAAVLTGTELGSAGLLGVGAYGGTLEPTESNPAGVYYAPGDLKIHSDSQVRGTLIVRGNLEIVGNNILIRAQPGFPALIVGGNVNFNVLSVAPFMRVEGLMYVNGRCDGSGLLLPTLEVEGAMLVRGTSPVFLSLPLSYLRVRYNPDMVRIPDFSEVGSTPISVEMLAWEPSGGGGDAEAIESEGR